jgi:hypothetical protein
MGTIYGKQRKPSSEFAREWPFFHIWITLHEQFQYKITKWRLALIWSFKINLSKETQVKLMAYWCRVCSYVALNIFHQNCMVEVEQLDHLQPQFNCWRLNFSFNEISFYLIFYRHIQLVSADCHRWYPCSTLRVGFSNKNYKSCGNVTAIRHAH